MTKIEKRIERILEDLKNNCYVDVEKFLEDFNISESTLRRDVNRVIKYIAYEDVVKSDYGIDSAIELELYIHNTQRISSIIANDEDPTNQVYLENLFSQINKLPKRSDLKYKEIQNFKDYELTYSIVNEMAIRNKQVIKLCGIFHKLVTLQDEKNKNSNDYEKALENNTNLSKEVYEKYKKYLISPNIFCYESLIKKIFLTLNKDYMISPLECRIDGINYIPGKIYDTLQKYDKFDIQSIRNGEQRLNSNLFNKYLLKINVIVSSKAI